MAEATASFLLASSSPRRRELLAAQGFRFAVASPDIDETPAEGETPLALVERLARAKADAVESDVPVLAADTVVSIDGDILGKPTDRAEASRMLRRLSGRTHQVASGVALRAGGTQSFTVVTDVHFVVLDDRRIDRYLATDEAMDKAGAYGIQGTAGAFVAAIDGSYTNVVGLPLAETIALLDAAGIAPAT